VRADQVLHVLDQIAGDGVTAWVDGGWGVDALLGRQTREHEDLDLVLDREGVDRVRDLLVHDGFQIVRDWLPTAMAFAHPDGRAVDVHPIEVSADGGGDQIQRDGRTRWHYGAPVTGCIAGRVVRCCSLETQIASHLGYEPDDQDRADMGALADRFGCDLPEPY
jgi:lincosamide nucleotidyltransferase A/C/D/E